MYIYLYMYVHISIYVCMYVVVCVCIYKYIMVANSWPWFHIQFVLFARISIMGIGYLRLIAVFLSHAIQHEGWFFWFIAGIF